MALLLKSKLWIAYTALVILNVLDAATTAILVLYYGPDVEANPIVRYWIYQHGVLGIFLIKFLVLAILWFVINFVKRLQQSTRAYWGLLAGLWICNSILSYVIYRSLIFIYQSMP